MGPLNSLNRRILRALLAALVITGAVGLAGCGASSPPVQAEAPSASTGETGATAASESTKFDVKRTGTWGFRIDSTPRPDEVMPENGAYFRVKLEIGEMTRLTDPDSIDQFASWGLSCAEVNAEQAVMIPLRLTARNLSDVALPLRVGLLPANTTTSTFPLRPTMANKMGCWDFVRGDGEQPIAEFGGELGPGKTGSEELVFVVRDYFGERFPNGQPTELREVQLAVAPEIGSFNLEQSCFIGGRDFEYFDLNIGQDRVYPRAWLYEPPANDYVEPNSVDEPRCS